MIVPINLAEITMKPLSSPAFRPVLRSFVPSLLLSAALLAGCATGSPDGSSGSASSAPAGSSNQITATDPARLTRSGFLSDYGRLKTTPWGDGIQCWRESNLNATQYNKVLVSRIVVSLKPAGTTAPKTIDPSDLKTLTDYFHNALVRDLKPVMLVVEQPGPGVLVIRIALTDLVPTTVSDSVAGTLIPYAFIAEAGSGVATGRPAGSTPYMGETGMEMQFRDGGNGQVIAECRDTQIGRKYAADVNAGAVGTAQTWASGYMNSFQAWSYAKNAFDKWSMLLARRLAELRGVAPKQ